VLSDSSDRVAFRGRRTLRTQQALHQLRVGRQRLGVAVDGEAAVLDLPQGLEVAQQHVTQPLGVDTRDLPLLGLLVFQPAGSEESST